VWCHKNAVFVAGKGLQSCKAYRKNKKKRPSSLSLSLSLPGREERENENDETEGTRSYKPIKK